MSKTLLLFLIILSEGYVVLASELLAIRQILPFVGSGTECVAIIISGVLLPLAVGYHEGGKAYGGKKRQTRTIRGLLLRNILIAMLFLGLGLSHPVLGVFFHWLGSAGLHNRLAQTAAYALTFLVVPVFLLGQTVPLVSNYFSKERLSSITGKMLFFSTAGSFCGSIISTVVLMGSIGVHNTVIVTMGLLTVLGMVVARDKLSLGSLSCMWLLAMVWLINATGGTHGGRMVADNAYNTVKIKQEDGGRIKDMYINNSLSSRVSVDPALRFNYIMYIEQSFIAPLVLAGGESKDILVLGSGGFTLGIQDMRNSYIFVDIDSELKAVSQKNFLNQELPDNKHFIAMSARAFVRSDTKKYDLIVLDTYSNTQAIPMETTTQDYLLDVKNLLKPGGTLAANIIASPSFSSRFSVRYDNTFSSVFANHTRQVLAPVTLDGGVDYANVIYVYYNNALSRDKTVYTDDKNSYSVDMP